jgi:ParB family transcriptional regulator, chromosome partitioning protein
MGQIIAVNPFRCRMWDLHDRLDQLVSEESCRAEISSFRVHGQLIPALGRALRNDAHHDVELICGARRLFIARHLNIALTVEVRDLSDREAIIARDIENRQRRDVSPYERGMFFTRCLRGGHFSSQEELASVLGISQSQVSRLLKLARLPTVIVNAFENPLEIREGWAPALTEALEDPQTRKRTIALARSLVELSPRPPAIETYQKLLSATASGRKPRTRTRDEVVTDSDGTALFRIRRQVNTVALLLPLESVSIEKLAAVRDAVRGVLKKNTPVMRSQRDRAGLRAALMYAAGRC